MFVFEIQILLAMLLDLLLGDPYFFPHPVRGLGFVIASAETFFRKNCASKSLAGLLTVLFVLVVSIGSCVFLLYITALFSTIVAHIVAIFLLYTTIALKDLIKHAKAVYYALETSENSDIERARKAVSLIVGRDTKKLDRDGIIRATVETVAENMVDGVTAPLFYAIILGSAAQLAGFDALFFALPGAVSYKSINTMDSMIAYKNEKYLVFGKWAAKLDDIANFLPSRLSGVLLIPAAAICGLNWFDAYVIFKKDRLAHASPNAGHSEAAVAGALGIRLGGSSIYFGKKVVKPDIGASLRAIDTRDILMCNRLVMVGSFLFVLLLFVVQILLQMVF